MINIKIFVSLNESDLVCIVILEEYVFLEEIEYGRLFFFVKWGFLLKCLCELDNCVVEEIYLFYEFIFNMLLRKLFYIEYILGVIVIILNFVVMFILFGCCLFCISIFFILLGNISVCDIFMGVYLVLIVRYIVYEFIVNVGNYFRMDVFVNDYCIIMGVIFMMV